MNKADALLAAHILCQRVNAAEPGICEFKPNVCYDSPSGGHCSILIHTFNDGDVFLRRLEAAGLKYEIDGFAFEGHQNIVVDGFKGATAIVCTAFLAQRETVAAAA